jgi:Holliday junction resolvase
MTESQIQAKILKYLNSEDECWAFKAESVVRGVPDIICCYRGLFVAFEVKRAKGGRVSVIQRAIMGKISDASGHASIVSSVKQVQTALDNIDKIREELG